jgi:hypothetical protein
MNSRLVALGVVVPLVLVLGCSSASDPDHPQVAPAASRSVSDSSYDAAISHPRVDPYYPAEGTTSLDALHYGLDLTRRFTFVTGGWVLSGLFEGDLVAHGLELMDGAVLCAFGV